MKIDKIQKRGSKYKIFLDNGDIIDTLDEVILSNNLLYNKNIDDELLEKIKTDTLYYASYNRVMTLISKRLRSRYEVKKYLKKLNVSLKDSEKMLKKLEDLGLIDDEKFARAYINDKINLSMVGPIKIMKELEKHNVDLVMVNSILSSIPKNVIDERIDKLLMKKVKANRKYSTYVLTQKIIQYLVNLGYGRADIDRHLDKIKTDKKVIEKEISKVDRLLSRKFSGDELKIRLKQKLYSRGFKSDDVEEYLNKRQF